MPTDTHSWSKSKGEGCKWMWSVLVLLVPSLRLVALWLREQLRKSPCHCPKGSYHGLQCTGLSCDTQLRYTHRHHLPQLVPGIQRILHHPS